MDNLDPESVISILNPDTESGYGAKLTIFGTKIQSCQNRFIFMTKIGIL